jgi:hypothetical protein
VRHIHVEEPFFAVIKCLQGDLQGCPRKWFDAGRSISAEVELSSVLIDVSA